MEKHKFFDAEYRFIKLIWDHEPVKSTELVKLCAEAFGWKKSTTFTMIKRLSERSMIKSENAIVSSLVKLHQVQEYESNAVMEKMFGGSLPSFITAFLNDKKLDQEESDRIIKMIQEATK